MRDDHVPPPPTQSRAQAWVTTLLIPLAVLLAVAGLGAVREAFMTPSPGVSAPTTASVDSSLLAALSALATPQAITVTLPDTLMVVTPTPEPIPTRPPSANVGPDICTDNTPKGTVCKQPRPPLPPPTEVPPCPVLVNQLCVAQGEKVRHLPTPIPIVSSQPPGGN